MDAAHLLNKCNSIITRRFIAYEPAKWEINAVLITVSSSCSIAYVYTYINLISWLKLALFRYRYFKILSDKKNGLVRRTTYSGKF